MKEIIAKKFRHREDKQTARDLLDFALVAEKEPNELDAAARFVVHLYFELTGALPPIKGGDPHLAREARDPAYLQATRQVGHARPQISGAYLGSRAGVGPSD
jgi:hypothetical protein